MIREADARADIRVWNAFLIDVYNIMGQERTTCKCAHNYNDK